MYVKNNTILHVAQASNSKRDCEDDLYCCLLPQCEALRTCRLGFPIATMPCTHAQSNNLHIKTEKTDDQSLEIHV